MEQAIFYLFMFIIGTVFGSFFTLSVYRIPLHQDITHERSYCPNCKHKLSFLDMVPVLSYIFLRGKCRYCKTKIRIRYLCLEIITGIIFLLFAISLNMKFNPLDLDKIVYLIFGILYIIGLVIIAGIDKEWHNINLSVILYEVIISTTYMVYLYLVEQTNIYRYAIYLFVLCILLFIQNIYLKTKLKNNYTIQILELSIIIAIYTGEILYILTVILTLLTVGIETMIKILKNNKNKVLKVECKYLKKIPFGYYLIFSNIILLIAINFIACRW